MRKFKVGDTLIRKPLPQYKGLERIKVKVVAVDDEYYHFEGGSVSSVKHEDHWDLYDGSNKFFWLNYLKEYLCKLLKYSI